MFPVRFLCFGGLISGCLFLANGANGESLSFNRDVRPILAEHCWKCHGFDAKARQGELRLDEFAAATKPATSGEIAIVPGKPETSELMARVSSRDDAIRMPPSSEKKRLTEKQIGILRQWIAEGAAYQKHWSFEPVAPVAPPSVSGVDHPIDAFITSKILSQDPSYARQEGDRDTLIRRVYYDLIGLPPTRDELVRARNDTWEQTVDQLLASPHFGERMAVDWLDAARYADTDGYFGDKPRQMWLWRDGVIEAFNRNLPFDQFTIEQLAGDLIPNATIAQRIASGFNRNHMSNDETGLIDEEYRVEYVADRVETTTATWLGLTVACAQCHDHKYDPISQREYYQLFAFFNNVPESGLLLGHDAPPRISVPSDEQSRRLADCVTASAGAHSQYEPRRATIAAELAQREATLLSESQAIPAHLGAIHIPLDGVADGASRHIGTALKPSTGIRGQAIRFDATQHIEHEAENFPVDGPWTMSIWLSSEKSLGSPASKIEPVGDRRGWETLWQKGRIGVHLVHQWETSAIEVATKEKLAANAWHHVVIRYDGSRKASGVSLFLNGVRAPVEIRRDSLDDSIKNSEPLRIARRDEGLGFYGSLDEFRWLPEVVSDEAIARWYHDERMRGILERPADMRSARDSDWLLDDYVDRHADAETRSLRDRLRVARADEQRVRESIPLALVMEEQATVRPTHVLTRGVYNQPGERVEAATPTALSPWKPDLPRNRLGLAQWLVSDENPLVARVAVNRLWRQCFGEGLVRTVNDFGTQGEPPTHPELLDYLADRFRQSGWDVKAMLRFIVTSRTYRQSSRMVVRGGEVVDPENRLWARGPRFRLPMEMIRDQSLTASGLLVRQLGGRSVKPFQPPGLWEEVSYDAESTYEVDRGGSGHRRGLYTFVKRQSPPPTLLLFDGPTREKCTLKRPRTNTPLQALALLNDEGVTEASRALASEILETARDDRSRIAEASRAVLSREPTDGETESLQRLLRKLRDRYASHPDEAAALAGHATAAELAAWTIVVHTLFNLDEAVTRK